jgi:NADPH:quinone reductase-like Zn-dependent oxidoreductase
MFRLVQILAAAPLYRRFAGKRLKIVALKQNHGLDYFNTLVESGQLRTIVDGPYPFDRLVEQLAYFREGRHQGKIVLTMPDV